MRMEDPRRDPALSKMQRKAGICTPDFSILTHCARRRSPTITTRPSLRAPGHHARTLATLGLNMGDLHVVAGLQLECRVACR